MFKTEFEAAWMRQRRSSGTQLLRDAALGYPEYPDITDKGTISNAPDIHSHYTDAAAYAFAAAVDRDILDSVRKR